MPDRTISSPFDSRHQWSRLGCRALVRLIGENPHPLVSARFPLHYFSSRNFAQDYHIRYRTQASLNSPDVSIPITRESCNPCVEFPMTVCANQHTFVNLLFHLDPASGIPFGRYPKVLLVFLKMMELKSLRTFRIPTNLAATSLIGYGFLTKLFSSPLHRSNKVLPPFTIRSRLFFHAESTAACSTIELSRNLKEHSTRRVSPQTIRETTIAMRYVKE